MNKKNYEIYFCYNCMKRFKILISGTKLETLIKKDIRQAKVKILRHC